MGLVEALVAWRDFYMVVAGASATLVGLVFVGISIDRAQARLPRHEPRVVIAYRFVVPLVAEVVLAVGAVAMIAGARPGVSAPAAYVVLMFVVGTENAWDLLLGSGGITPNGQPQ